MLTWFYAYLVHISTNQNLPKTQNVAVWGAFLSHVTGFVCSVMPLKYVDDAS